MSVEIAFIDKSDKLLQSRFFPSKVGGKPSWLDLKCLPSTEAILCNMCGLPRHFLCQIYSPIEEKSSAFHRTIFVFICLSENCFKPGSNENFVVFRNQLPLRNSYYPDTAEGIELRIDITCSKFGTNLCNICGIRGERQCEQCEECFCTEYHQKRHKNHATDYSAQPTKDLQILLPEFGLSSEPEDLSDGASDNSNPDLEEVYSDENEVANFCQNLTQFNSPQDEATIEEIFTACSETIHDETFLKFKTRISYYPDQVIRYSRNNPLWLSNKHQPPADSIPSCEYCGSARQFEFQVCIICFSDGCKGMVMPSLPTTKYLHQSKENSTPKTCEKPIQAVKDTFLVSLESINFSFGVIKSKKESSMSETSYAFVSFLVL